MKNRQRSYSKPTIVFLLLFSAFFGAASVSAQELKLIYDGRVDAKTAKISPLDENLLKREALPQARAAWKSDEHCEEGFEIQDAASGAFTRKGATQKAFLYRYCETGHNFGNDGIVIVENGRIAAHYVYDGGWDISIIALPDINENGINEIALGESGMHQGYGWSVVSIIELAGKTIEKFGIFDTWADDCGAEVKNCGTTAFKIIAKPGNHAAFYHEKYRKVKAAWRISGKSAIAKPREDTSVYRRLK